MAHVTVQDVATRGTYSASTATSFTIPSTLAFFALTDFRLFSGTTELSYNATPTTSTQFATSGSAVDGGYMGGNFVLGSASSGNNLTYIRNTPATRTDDFTYPSGTLNIKTLNTALDKLFAVSQQLDSRLDRALVQDDSDTGSVGDLGLYSDRASKFLQFDANGQVAFTALTLSGTTVSVSAYILGLLDDSDAATARTTLGASSSLTFPLAVASGGTGSSTVALAQAALGIGALGTTDQITASSQIASAVVTYAKIQDVAAASRLLGRGSTAGSGDVEEITLGTGLTMSGTTISASGGATLGTAQSTTSGTSKDFTGIPSGTKRITINYRSVGTGGTSPLLIQLGDAGGIETTGYTSNATRHVDGDTSIGVTASSVGFISYNYNDAADTVSGSYVLSIEDSSDFTWCGFGIMCNQGQRMSLGSGLKSLSAELTQLRITSTSTDTFDSGEVNIVYE